MFTVKGEFVQCRHLPTRDFFRCGCQRFLVQKHLRFFEGYGVSTWTGV